MDVHARSEDGPPVTAAEAERQVVVFSWHGERYAVPIGSVREIIRYRRPTAVATRSELIRGVLHLRGRVVPVIDVSSRLGHELGLDAQTRILVLELANGTVGLIVDTVEGVRGIPANRIEPLPVADVDAGLGREIAAMDDELIVLIDPEQALGDVLPGRPESRPGRAEHAQDELDGESVAQDAPAAPVSAGGDPRPDLRALSHPRRRPAAPNDHEQKP